MIIKAIVLDIDGTLLNTGKIISEKTKQALIAAQEKGIKVILASGRPTTGMLELAEQLEMTNMRASSFHTTERASLIV